MTRWKAALAALACLPLPGFGQALAGRTRRALIIATISLTSQALIMVLQAADDVTPALLYLTAGWMVLALAATLVGAADAWRCARVPSAAHLPGWRRRGVVVAAVVALNAALLLVPDEPVTWSAYSVPSASMQPTLNPGDRFVAQQDWYLAHKVQRGEVAVFALSPAGTVYVKRVIGLPGDHVRMQDGVLLLNDQPVPTVARDGVRRSWQLPGGRLVTVLKGDAPGPADTTAMFTVPDGHVFVLGDNLDNSYDSRLNPQMRYVPITALLGRAAIIYWPFTAGRSARMIR